MEIKDALAKLDHKNDDQWTADGSPRVDVVAAMVGNEKLTRKDITNASPNFVRDAENGPSPSEDDVEQETEVSTGQEQQPAVVQSPDVEEAIEEDFEDKTPTCLQEALELTGSDFVEDRDLFEPSLKFMDDEMIEIERERVRLMERQKFIQQRRAQLAQHQINTEPRGNAKSSWLKRQNEIRAAKAERARRFFEGSGASPDEVREALNVRSPIDNAMRGRKTTLGSQRPQRQIQE